MYRLTHTTFHPSNPHSETTPTCLSDSSEVAAVSFFFSFLFFGAAAGRKCNIQSLAFQHANRTHPFNLFYFSLFIFVRADWQFCVKGRRAELGFTLKHGRCFYSLVNPHSFTRHCCAPRRLFLASWGSGLDMLCASNYSSQLCQMIKCFIIECAAEEQMKCTPASLACIEQSIQNFFLHFFFLGVEG